MKHSQSQDLIPIKKKSVVYYEELKQHNPGTLQDLVEQNLLYLDKIIWEAYLVNARKQYFIHAKGGYN